MRIKLISLGILTLAMQWCIAKEGYKITCKFSGIPAEKCFLANHFGDKQYIQDSCEADRSGNFVFQGSKSLPGGMYLVVLPSKRYLEVMIDKEQFFSIEGDSTLSPEMVKVKGSTDNKQFYDYLAYISAKNKAIQPLRDRYNALSAEEQKTSHVREQMKAIDDDVANYKDDFMKKNPQAFLTAIFNYSESPDVPEPPVNPDGSIDSNFAYNYYKGHFWDKINFADARMLRTPIYHQKLVEYFDKLVYQIPDSINKEADMMVIKAEADTEVWKYTVWFITYHFETSKIMGLDAVFVHMVNNYYKRPKAYWLSDDGLYKIQERAKQLDPILLGKKVRNIVLQDSLEHYRSMYDIRNKYTLLLFWDPDCGHCQKVVPKVRDFYDKTKQNGIDLEVYGVCTEAEVEKWKKYMREKNLNWINVADFKFRDNFRHDFDISTTPQIFLLDTDKKLIAKKLEIEQVEDLIKRREGKEN
ncbi:MAG: DUF5106 domain-containing protein [Bacteroidetes bacterium]|nr:DUF5106 domain-containing protein [Bacteroidota bacterium]